MCSSALLAVESPIAEPSPVIYSYASIYCFILIFCSLQFLLVFFFSSIHCPDLTMYNSMLIELSFALISILDSQIHGLRVCGYFYGGAAVKTDHLRVHLPQRIILSISIQSIGFSGRYRFADIRLYRVS